MEYLYTTIDGQTFMAGDGTVLVVGPFDMITDRTLADVDAVKALTERIKTGAATEAQVQEYLNVLHKGAYTYRDMNRVEDAVQYVAQRMRTFSYLASLPALRVWTVADKPSEADLNQYFNKVATLRNAITVMSSTPDAPNSAVGFDVTKANALEQILVDIEHILTRISLAWFYSGDLYAGEM